MFSELNVDFSVYLVETGYEFFPSRSGRIYPTRLRLWNQSSMRATSAGERLYTWWTMSLSSPASTGSPAMPAEAMDSRRPWSAGSGTTTGRRVYVVVIQLHEAAA